MTTEEFAGLVEFFRLLKRWRDEDELVNTPEPEPCEPEELNVLH